MSADLSGFSGASHVAREGAMPVGVRLASCVGSIMCPVILSSALWFSACAENIVFPTKSGIKSVVSDYGAKGDGKTDDTQALLAAFKGANAVGVYIPNGTYRVTGPMLCNTSVHGPWIYGQSRDGVVIKLDDNATGFSNASSPQPVLAAHSIGPNGAISADIFFRQWHNFTIDAGNNAGAIGIRFYSNNSGTLDNVLIKGAGVYGLDMGWTNMNGPLLIQNVVVEGFGIGIYTANGINSQTMTNITIRNSRTAGISASGQNLMMEDVTIENVPTAIIASGMVCLVNGTFKGSDATKPAIRNTANLYCRAITTQGFSRAIESSNGGVAGAVVTEFTSEAVASAFTGSRTTSLNLPIKKTPALNWEEDTAKWVFVGDHGALPGDRYEDSQGFQAAIDAAAAAGKTTVYARSGSYTIVNNVTVHGSVRHVFGTGDCQTPLTFSSASGPKGFVLGADAAPVVRFSDFGRCAGLTFTSNNTSTMIVENCVDMVLVASGAGDAFINNCVATVTVNNPAAHVWARQLNTEGAAVDSDNKGGFLWILGLKTEKRSTKVRTTAGGMSEVIGGHIYNNNCSGPTTLFEVVDAYASFASIRETSFCGGPYSVHVSETRSGTTKTWLDGLERAWALYVAADQQFVPPASVGVRRTAPDDTRKGHGALSLDRTSLDQTAIFDCRGSMVGTGSAAIQGRRTASGVYIVKTAAEMRCAVGRGR